MTDHRLQLRHQHAAHGTPAQDAARQGQGDDEHGGQREHREKGDAAGQEVAVVFDPDAGRAIFGLLASCINGGAIWRKSSYLSEREGQPIASELVTLVDDPLIPRGPGSRPFDGEGLLSRKNVVVDAGVLKTFLLDSYSGRKLGKASTGNASRGSGGGVGASTTNFLLQPGSITRDELIRRTDRALYVTDMMGFGFNAVTGDFSRGASGFWI